MDAPRIQASRVAAEKLGRRAEWLAALHLTCRGFQILARRFRAGSGEADIVARRGGLLVLAEVKARPTLDEALFAITPRMRKRIEAAGGIFVSRHPGLARLARRYDIFAVAGWRVRHIPDAWREEDV